jgi:hypothetical protein
VTIPPLTSAPTPAVGAAGSAAAADRSLREQTIYVPYQKLRETFEKQGRGVFLPYEKFQELWQAARERPVPATPDKPPVGALITEIDSQSIVERDTLKVTSRLQVELLAAGWHLIPLRLGDAAIISAKWGDQPAHVIYQQDGYYVLVQHDPKPAAAKPAVTQPADTKPAETKPAETKPDEAKPAAAEPTPVGTAKTVSVRRELVLEFAKAYVKQPGRNTVSFEAPQAPVHRWKVTIPQAGAKITVQPTIAANELTAAGEAGKPAAESALLAFVGAAATVQVEWTAKAEGAAGLEALINVQARQQAFIDEGVVRTQTVLNYDIQRAEVAQLQLELATDHRVINIFDANVRQWESKQQEEKQIVTVQLFQPVRGAQNLTIETEKILLDMNQKELPVPAVKALRAGRQQGVVLVKVGAELRGDLVRRVGLTQLDPSELPPELVKTAWDFLFRYSTLPFNLAISLERVKPRIQVDELVEAYLEPEQLTAQLLALYNIERAGVFQFELTIPEGYELRDVRGQAVAGVEAAAVDSHRLEGDDKTKLIVALSRKALGRVGLVVELQKRLQDGNLLTPTGESSELPVPLPRAAVESLERATGRLVLFAPEALRINPQTQSQLRVITQAEAYEGVESLRGNRFPTTRPVLAFAYGKPAATLTLEAQRRRPAITAKQLLIARCDTGVVKYEARFLYDIRYSSVKSVRIDVPAELASKLHNETPAIREKVIEKPEPAPAEGWVAWSFTGETELFGEREIRLTWEVPLEELAVGGSRSIDLPRLQPAGADLDRAWGQILVTKAETLDIQPTGEPLGIRPIDHQHDLQFDVAVDEVARAFEFQQPDWRLSLQLRRYQLEDVKRTSIERGLLRMVVTRNGDLAVQAIYVIRSVRQRIGVQLPANYVLDTQPLKVFGVRQDLEVGDGGELFVPLVSPGASSGAEEVLVELRYTIPKGAGQLQLPRFSEDPAIQQIHLVAYVPREWTVVGWNGSWSEEFDWVRRTPLEKVPSGKFEDAALLQKMLPSAPSTMAVDDFPVDGYRYLFSTLRPDAASDNALKLVTLRRLVLHGIVIGLLVIVGYLGLRGSWSQRISLVLGLVLAVMLCQVFLPTLGQQLMDGASLSVSGLWALIWTLQGGVARLRSRWMSGGQGGHDSTAERAVTRGNLSDVSTMSAAESDAASDSVSPFAESAEITPADETRVTDSNQPDQETK